MLDARCKTAKEQHFIKILKVPCLTCGALGRFDGHVETTVCTYAYHLDKREYMQQKNNTREFEPAGILFVGLTQ